MNLLEISAVAADESEAFALVEQIVWPHGPVCPHCENKAETGKPIYTLDGVKDKRGRVRYGLKKCGACRKQFTVRVGTIFEDSHIPLGKWLLAIHQMCSSKKGMSAKQLQRELGITYKSAWFMCHRIRLAMTQQPLRGMLGEGPVNTVVEIDETYVGGSERNNKHKDYQAKPKAVVMTLIERGGYVRTFPVPNAKRGSLVPVALMNIAATAHIVTDQNAAYRFRPGSFVSHSVINKAKEGYVRGLIHTNFAESYHSLLKRGIFGTFHHVSQKHLPRYLREFEFRWNTRTFTDGERTEKAVRDALGKRLTYKAPSTKRAKLDEL
jgi:transposase-like protein